MRRIGLVVGAMCRRPWSIRTSRRDDTKGRLRVIASPDGRDGSVTVHANAVVYVGVFGTGDAAELVLSKKHAWVHVATGAARVNGQELREGDGASFTNEERVRIEGNSPEGEVLVFDLPE